ATRIEKDKHRAMEVLELLSTPKNVFELTMTVYAQVFKEQLGLTLSKTIGYLDFLENVGAVKIEEKDGVNYYVRLD
ncbi:hypothetical protein SB749_19845, partial [Brevibacterium sp. SIMBA_078]|uniref:hypothetical protein n=1 Tax=Brevibacterium sp. SIMBA_078 TaxID=3085816 RepID=UPI00397B95E0